MEDFHRLAVYQKARAFSLAINEVVKRFPIHLQRKLGAQLEDAAESIGANIAEGCGRKNKNHGNAELIRYYHYSFGSACEAEHRLQGARDRGIIDVATHARLNDQLVEIKRTIAGMIRALETRDRGRLKS
jgi:four helix bundle protein